MRAVGGEARLDGYGTTNGGKSWAMYYRDLRRKLQWQINHLPIGFCHTSDLLAPMWVFVGGLVAFTLLGTFSLRRPHCFPSILSLSLFAVSLFAVSSQKKFPACFLFSPFRFVRSPCRRIVFWSACAQHSPDRPPRLGLAVSARPWAPAAAATPRHRNAYLDHGRPQRSGTEWALTADFAD